MPLSSAEQEALLACVNATLSLAGSTRFYRDHWKGRTYQLSDLDLTAIPTIDKSHLVARGVDMLTTRRFPDQVILSGGTTHASGMTPAFRQADLLEYEAVSRLTLATRRRVPPHPITLEFGSDLHGAPIGRRPFTFRLPLLDVRHFEAALFLLATEHDYSDATRKVEYISGSKASILSFCQLLEQRGQTQTDWAVRGVVASGAHLTSEERKYISGSLEAEVVETYGLSEVTGSITLECEFCGNYHPRLTAYLEFLPLNKDDSQSCLRELCVTTVAPLQTRQPLVRYRTGDIVRIYEDTCPRGFGFRPVGRVQDSVRLTDLGVLVVPSFELAEIVSDFPAVWRTPYAGNARLGLGDRPGTARFATSVSSSGGGLVFTLGVDASSLAREDRREITDRVHQLFTESNPEMTAEVRLEVRPLQAREYFLARPA